MSVTIQKTQDYDMILHLAQAIWQDHYVPMLGQAQVDYMLARFYSATSLATQAQDGQDFWLILQNNVPKGYIGITAQGEGLYFLNKFYINTSLQGQGIGVQVFEQILAQYSTWKTLRLQVNINNYKSINFYFKMGLKIEKRFVLDIGEGFMMDDFIMIKNK